MRPQLQIRDIHEVLRQAADQAGAGGGVEETGQFAEYVRFRDQHEFDEQVDREIFVQALRQQSGKAGWRLRSGWFAAAFADGVQVDPRDRM
jgi:hypothetical protein